MNPASPSSSDLHPPSPSPALEERAGDRRPSPSAPTASAAAQAQARLPLRGWALELARRWNGGTYSVFILHGNIFDVFPVQEGKGVTYAPLKTFLARRLFPERFC